MRSLTTKPAEVATHTLGATLVVAALLAATCADSPAGVTAEVCDPTIGQQVTDRINEVRSEQGLAALTVDLRLIDAAAGHSADMAANGFVGHTGDDGTNAGQRIERSGYSWNYYSENVAAGQADAAAVVDAWMGSSGHRANILAADAKNLGVGYVQQGGTEFTHYWTVNFGATSGQLSAPSDGCHP